jgi:hypothetical protein
MRSGQSWLTAVVRRDEGIAAWRFLHYAEMPIYAGEQLEPPPLRVWAAEAATAPSEIR